ncbi:MAG: hypothetical protein ABI365_04390, partial [Lysobacteraceae bacterium]
RVGPTGDPGEQAVVRHQARDLIDPRLFETGTGGDRGGVGDLTLDLLAVAQWAQQARPDDQFWLGGFSFGAWIALLGARHLPATQLITIAPPADRWDFSAALPPTCPWLVIQGEADDIVSPQSVYDWLAKLDAKPTLVKMPDTGHFFHRRLMDLRGAIKNGVRRNLPPLLHV